MEYCVKLDLFEGPLDLLLHLVQKSKIEIADISMATITEQYLDYLDRMRDFDVEIASEFLVMASTLLLIKSRALLPGPDDLGEDDEDPEQELRKRLEEYKKYKEISQKLREREERYSNIYHKLPEELIDENEKKNKILVDGNPHDLIRVLIRLLKNERSTIFRERVYPIRRQAVTIQQRIRELRKLFSITSECRFTELFRDKYDRSNIIITFLALLEMLKDNQISIYQNKQFGEIIIKGGA
ncbi:MAG TPA: segregation/condensation protein A [Clostridiales bacterium]|jgi:segregation and condensation protein A|nr:segregation/condensation protein A [Clostridiales bacterium]